MESTENEKLLRKVEQLEDLIYELETSSNEMCSLELWASADILFKLIDTLSIELLLWRGKLDDVEGETI